MNHTIFQSLKMKALLICILSYHMAFAAESPDTYPLSSPDHKVKAEILVGQKILFSVFFNGERLIDNAPVSMKLENKVWGEVPKVISQKSDSENELIKTVYGGKKEINNQYNQLTLEMEGNYSLVFRACNQGVSYRFISNIKDELTIYDEELGLKISGAARVWEPRSPGYETAWKLTDVSGMEKGKKLSLPLLFDIETENRNKVKLAVTEADLNDYPSLFLSRASTFENDFNAVFEKYPLSTKYGGFNNFMEVPDTVANFIAKTKGTRKFPWRVFIITDDDRDLVDNDLVFCLSSPQKLRNTEWIQPGQVLWDWWHDYNIEGVDFETGINTNSIVIKLILLPKIIFHM